MSNLARDNILARLKEARKTAITEPADLSVLDEFKWDLDEKVRRYKEVTQAVNTQVVETNQQELIKTLQKIMDEKGVQNLLYGAQSLWANKLLSEWADCPVELKAYDQIKEDCKDMLFHVDASLTASVGAIAQTGSLILWPSAEEPRLMSLTPPIHFCVVQKSNFFNTFHEAVLEKNWTENMPTNPLLISGPSKTADIEQELCYGVHGPKELVVLLLED